MNARTLSAAVAIGGLMSVSGTVLADAQDAYHRAFFGDSGAVQTQTQMESGASMGKAAYGAPTTTALAQPKGGTMVLTTTGLRPWIDVATPDAAGGKAAFGSGTSGIETGHDGYNRGFFGD